MRIVKWTGVLVLALIAVSAVLAAFNWERLVRLHAVNTLFSEEKIVGNFSNMEELFVTAPVPSSGTPVPWGEALEDLPPSFASGDGERELSEWLAETKTTSLMVIQEGRIVHEAYFLGTGAQALRISWSVAKSFLSAAFGVAVGDGLIDIDKPLETYVPAFADSVYQGVTVRNALNMSTGVRFNEDYLDFWSDINKMGRVLALGGSMDDFALGLTERARDQGVARQYVSIDTHVLAMVLRAATGRTLPDYLAEKIITPLGFTRQPYYLTDSEGNAFALGGLNITTRDYARFGQMMLDDGKWRGAQVVPADWVAASTVASAPASTTRDRFAYGFQWWIPHASADNGRDYLARGIYGQYIYVNPRTRTVIVRTAANRKFREPVDENSLPTHVHVDMFRAIAAHVSR